MYGMTGRTAHALAVLDELRARAEREYTPAWSLGVVHAGLGRMDEAFDCLEQAADAHESLMLHVHVHPNYDGLRAHPRYPALLRKMNLEPDD